jgi:hypothetical protein
MQKIFLVSYSVGEYIYLMVNVQAFFDRDAANAFAEAESKKIDFALNALNEFNRKQSEFISLWDAQNPMPVMDPKPMQVPVWLGGKGSMKKADPLVVVAFKEAERKAREVNQIVKDSNQKKSDEYSKMRQEAIQKFKNEYAGVIPPYIGDCERSYFVEEINLV